MKRLFHNVVWPAVAGNVAWAFFTVLTEANWSDHNFWARLIALFAVAGYLAADWYNTDSIFESINPDYWVADFFLAPAIAIFAIASTQTSSTWAPYAIGIAFVVAIVGHLLGAWDRTKRGTSDCCVRMKLAAINFFGLVVLVIGTAFDQPYRDYSGSASISLATFFFLLYVCPRKSVGRRQTTKNPSVE